MLTTDWTQRESLCWRQRTEGGFEGPAGPSWHCPLGKGSQPGVWGRHLTHRSRPQHTFISNRINVVAQKLRSPRAGCPREQPLSFRTLVEGDSSTPVSCMSQGLLFWLHCGLGSSHSLCTSAFWKGPYSSTFSKRPLLFLRNILPLQKKKKSSHNDPGIPTCRGKQIFQLPLWL